jgi:hypothetical protein
MLRTLVVTTNIGCKNMCNYCPQSTFTKAYKKRSKINQIRFDTFKKCVDKVPRDALINFAGFTEPCLNPDWTQMILYANQLGFKIRLLTTTVGMTLSDVDKIENIPFVRFVVHLPDDKQQTKIKVDKQFIEVTNRLLDSRMNVEWKYHQSPLINEDLHSELKPIFIKANIYDTIKKAGLKTRARHVKIQGQAEPEKISGNISGCHLLYTNQLLPNGDVFICCMDWNLYYFLGNLLQCDYEELFQGKTFQDILKAFTDDNSEILCRYCELCQRA